MQFFKALLVGASALSLVSAQSILAITSTITEVTAGEPIDITYSGGMPNEPVTIVLRQGESNNLRTVGTITEEATGGSYSWTPDTSLTNGEDYAIEIRQGAVNNYSGKFSLEGGVEAGGASASASQTSSSVSSVISSVLASASSALNSTLTNATTTMPGMVGSAASAGTGMPMSRNTTFTTPSLSSTVTETDTETESTATATRTGGGSGSTSATSSPSATGSAPRMQISSPLAFVFCLVAAVMYLN